jgi:hypothetical protein
MSRGKRRLRGGGGKDPSAVVCQLDKSHVYTPSRGGTKGTLRPGGARGSGTSGRRRPLSGLRRPQCAIVGIGAAFGRRMTGALITTLNVSSCHAGSSCSCSVFQPSRGLRPSSDRTFGAGACRAASAPAAAMTSAAWPLVAAPSAVPKQPLRPLCRRAKLCERMAGVDRPLQFSFGPRDPHAPPPRVYAG